MRSHVLLATAGALVALAAPAHAGGVAPLTTVRVASGLNRPVFATHAPGDTTRLFIIEQLGVIKIWDLTTETLVGDYLNIDALVAGPTSNFDERGLLGLAFHPDYANNGYFYVNYTNNASDTVVARYTVSANPNVADAASAVTILTVDQPQSNHNGGWLGFGPDGYLYVAMGDGGNLCDTGTGHTTTLGNAQDITTNLLGKMLRLIPSTTPAVGGYTIPPTNPFVGITGDDEIWAYGLRNPWRNSFDRTTGDLYIGDVGQDAIEEIDFQPASSVGGENYGWRCFEGNSCSNVSGCSIAPCNCVGTGLVFPIHTYSHATGFSITGGYVYRGCDIPSLQGTYFLADYGTSRIWTFKYVGGVMTEFTERTAELAPGGGLTIASIASFGEDANGEIYIVDRAGVGTGEIYKVFADTGLPDFDCDGLVSTTDFLDLLAHWGTCTIEACDWDLNRDGIVDTVDFLTLLGLWS
jgi:glucose/arabinose dehydrogenase